MNTKELLKKIRTIEIKTRGLSNQVFSGEYHSAFKGRGMAFSEVREYSAGDDIRTIDWNVTARFNNPYVKVFEEERELTVMLLIDLSASGEFGTRHQLKRELITELAAVIAFSATKNNDKIGAILFTDQIERFIPPKKGKTHILRIISDILGTTTKSKNTNISVATKYLTNAIKKRSIAFLISDFISTEPLEESLRIVSRRHDVVALKIEDEAEKNLAPIGFMQVLDSESGETKWVLSTKKNQVQYKAKQLEKSEKLKSTFRKVGIDYAVLTNGKPYVKALMNLFKSRGK